jgi:hypothetical protein
LFSASPIALPYGVGEGEAEADALGEPEADASTDALSEADGAALPDALGTAEKLGSGFGVGDGKRVVGTFANERAKIRMKMTTTISTQGRARVSLRGGRAPRYPAGGAASPRPGPRAR